MNLRSLSGEKRLLRIYLGEAATVNQKPLYKVIVEKARELKMAGCTVFRGRMSFGASGYLHNVIPVEISGDLPLLIELVDTSEHIAMFIQETKLMLSGALVTEETIRVRHYSHGGKNHE